jgi:hypothetical protein
VTRLAGALLAVSLLVTGCTAADPDPGAVPDRGRCAGVEYAAVRGRAPDAGAAELLDHPVADAVCAAYWIPQVDDRFVPQGLAVRGRTAYVGGYRWAPDYATRPCQIAVVYLPTGRVRTFVDRFEAPVYGPRPTYCRHGGGLESTREGLWVAETERLWLLDPDRLGHGDPVLRVWRLDRGVRGSTLAIGHGRLGLGSYRSERPGRITWYRLADVLAPGVDHLVAPGGGAVTSDVEAVRRDRAPARLQGLVLGPGGVWTVASSTRCSALRGPGRGPVAFVPGAEDLEPVGRDVWTVSEAGAAPYADDDEPTVPMLLRLERGEVLAGPRSTCPD